ncbi:MAG: PilN domain-containing protein [Oceanicoccus sp.]
MANINLLPWREERRQAQKQSFLVVLGVVAGISLLLVALTHMFVSASIDGQSGRNGYLKKQISELDQQVKEIKELENKRNELLERMKVIQDLQGNRPVIVRVFDEMVRTLPDGVFYEKLVRTKDVIKLQGIAESNQRVSSLMRKVDRSDWFASPNLTAVKEQPKYGEQASEFNMLFSISTPAAAAAAESEEE